MASLGQEHIKGVLVRGAKWFAHLLVVQDVPAYDFCIGGPLLNGPNMPTRFHTIAAIVDVAPRGLVYAALTFDEAACDIGAGDIRNIIGDMVCQERHITDQRNELGLRHPELTGWRELDLWREWLNISRRQLLPAAQLCIGTTIETQQRSVYLRTAVRAPISCAIADFKRAIGK